MLFHTAAVVVVVVGQAHIVRAVVATQCRRIVGRGRAQIVRVEPRRVAWLTERRARHKVGQRGRRRTSDRFERRRGRVVGLEGLELLRVRLLVESAEQLLDLICVGLFEVGRTAQTVRAVRGQKLVLVFGFVARCQAVAVVVRIGVGWEGRYGTDGFLGR